MINSDLCRNALKAYFSGLNDKQQEAVFKVNGSVLIIAGAGSGKTTVICNRVANMIMFGDGFNNPPKIDVSAADEEFLRQFAANPVKNEENAARLTSLLANNPIKPWNILVITFTNKAAGELKDRLASMLGGQGGDVNASTFHSACVRILRSEIDKLGYSSSFTIYDSDDSQRVIKDIMKSQNISDKAFAPRAIQTEISRAKDRLCYPAEFLNEAETISDFFKKTVASVYQEYQSRLKAANALDFDDIIALTVQIFEQFPESLEKYQRKYTHIMVDEYQDTNHAQYRLVSLLAAARGNLCVVGDDDQSIYKFRGATIENILGFEKEFKDAAVIRLEQNYRSTGNILSAANAVISNNSNRKDKNLWSAFGDGEKISINRFYDEKQESYFVADTIHKAHKDGKPYSDFALLYRTNAQSRSFELAMSRGGIPYKIVGGVRFYERKEIRDILAYLSVINNPNDIVRLKRIINEPKRGIGDTTTLEIERIALGLSIPAVEVMLMAEEYPSLSRKTNVLQSLGMVFKELMEEAEELPLDALIDSVLEKTGYRDAMLALRDEGAARLENIEELKSNVISYMQEHEDFTLSDFLEEVALISDIDGFDGESDRVSMMTMHSAKGLEFDTVFVVGAEENLFPSFRSIQNGDDEIEEERRLAYVAITRAKKQLYITSVSQRLIFGQTQRNRLSRFVKEIPEEYATTVDNTKRAAEAKAFKKPEKKPGYLQSGGNITRIPPAQPVVKKHFAVGDTVSHSAFGEGTVMEATPMGNDTMLDIDFKFSGRKKVMANFAKIEKI